NACSIPVPGGAPMTEMSPPSLDCADEFGGLDHLVLPGQDPELLHRIHASLMAELNPENFIARMWVRDMAIGIARAEYARMVDCAVQNYIQEEAPRGTGEGQEGEREETGEDTPVNEPPQPQDR